MPAVTDGVKARGQAGEIDEGEEEGGKRVETKMRADLRQAKRRDKFGRSVAANQMNESYAKRHQR